MKCVFCIKFYNGIILEISACTIMPSFCKLGHIYGLYSRDMVLKKERLSTITSYRSSFDSNKNILTSRVSQIFNTQQKGYNLIRTRSMYVAMHVPYIL